MENEEDKNIIDHDAQIVEEKILSTKKGNFSLPPVRPFWMDMLIILGIYLGSTIILGVVAGLLVSLTKADTTAMTVIAQIAVYVITIPSALWLLRARGMKRPILSFSFKKADPLMVLWGFILIFIMGVVLEPLIDIFPEQYLENINDMVINGGSWGMFMVVILAPICEEILFRGIIQGGAAHEYKPLRAILIASAIFAMVHIVPQQVINAFFCGIILGYVYYRTGSLIPVILIHALNNGIAYISIRMSPEKSEQTMREMINSDVWYWIIYAICAVIFIFALLNLWKQLNKVDNKSQVATK